MKVGLLSLLICPNCGGRLEARCRRPEQGEEIESALLSCACSEFPVVGGIPIFTRGERHDVMNMTTDRALRRGPEMKVLKDLVRSGSGREALRLLLVPAGRIASKVLGAEELLPGRVARALRLRELAYRAWTKKAKKEDDLLLDPDAPTTAVDAFDFYRQRLGLFSLYNYSKYRFGQPRYLSALALATLLPASPGPVLDLACGFGHLLHYWSAANPGHPLVGVDRNFFQVYVAKRWVAPEAEYVCCEADRKLPFATGSFGGVYCSDAFHYFLRKLQSAEEMVRVVEEDGIIVLTRVGNAGVEPREGYELQPEQYLRLLPDLPSRLIPDRFLQEDYRRRLGPQLATPAREAAAREKWLSLVASRRSDIFRNHPRFSVWPHGYGRRRIHPLYRQTGRDAAGTATLQLTFPSELSEFENADCRSYLPARIEVEKRVLADLREGVSSAPVEDLVDRGLAMGYPPRFR